MSQSFGCNEEQVKNLRISSKMKHGILVGFLPSATKFAKVMFLQVSVCRRGCLGPHPRKKLRGLDCGLSKPTAKGEVEGFSQGVCPEGRVSVQGRCLPRGCLPTGCRPGGCLPRGLCLGGVCPGGVCPGDVCSRG